ncbi:MAG: aspartate aminotransferase family protein [Clostridia bacterium]|nr:aspartate aminotransferase family protein [Clostridia bacterium]
MDVKALDNLYIANTYNRADICFVKGKGSLLYDDNGKEYIDLGSGIAVNTFGIADDDWVKAVCEQASTLQHVSNLYYTKPQAKLAERICEISGMKKVFFGNSGAEANECAIKAARKYSHDKYGDGRNLIVTLKSSFHGRTVTTLSATGQDVFHTDFMPFTDGFIYAEPNDLESMKQTLESPQICAVMMETIQGEGGINVLENAFVKETAKICKEKDILIIIDEVQTGNGRTGKYFSYMHYGISPDIVTTAKGIAGGLPMGACLFNEKTGNVMTAGKHGSTFGGNPVCAAAALSVIDRIDEKLLTGVMSKEKLIKGVLSKAKGVESVTGRGLMIGVKIKGDLKKAVSFCLNNGVVVLTAKDKIRLLPALNIPDELLLKALEVIKKAAKFSLDK